MKNTPWNYTEAGDVVDSTGSIVSVTGIAQPRGYIPADDDSYEHGRLLAAAPDLLESLKEVVRLSDRKTDVWDKAKAAIAKAEGHGGLDATVSR